MGMRWGTLLRRLQEEGFEVFYQETYPAFTYSFHEEREVEVCPHLLVAANTEEKALIVANSYFPSPDREDVNLVRVYGCVFLPKNMKFTLGGREIWGELLTDTYSIREAGEGHRCYYLQYLSDGFDFAGRLLRARNAFQIASWEDPGFLWFINRTEDPADWKKKRDEVLAQAPPEVKQFIGMEAG